MDRMAAEAPSWAVGRRAAEAAMDGRLLAAVTAWDPEPTRSTAVGTSINMTIVARIGTAITSTHIGTAIGRMADTAIIVRTAAIMVRPTDVVPPTDTDAGKVVADRNKYGPSSSPARGAGEPLSGAGLC